MSEWLHRHTTGLASALCSVVALGLLAHPTVAAAETCPNEALRNGPSSALPDCRAYEQVSPPFKEESLPELRGTTFGLRGLTGASADGSKVDVASIGNFGDAANNQFGASYELTRTASGWVERNLDLPASQFPASAPLDATPDLSETLWEARATAQPLNEKDLLLRSEDGSLNDLGPVHPLPPNPQPPGLGFGVISQLNSNDEFQGASEDLSHVLYRNEVNEHAQGLLYEYDRADPGSPLLVGASVGNGVYDGVSASGGAVFFTGPGGVVYAQLGEAQVVALSNPSSANCAACGTSGSLLPPATFDGASADGSKIFFTTKQPLLGADSSANIYEYDFDNPAGGKIMRVSAGSWGPGGAQVKGVFSVSRDGSHMYFIAEGDLAGAANARGQHPSAGGENLYVFERDAQFPEGRLSFIATLAPSESERCLEEGGCNATVTPDGRFLAFTSFADLTSDDTSSARQVFRYDAQTGALVRVSIGQNGFNQNGNTDVFNATIPGSERGIRAAGFGFVTGYKGGLLAMSDDGAYIVFQSADGLTSQALNGTQEEFETEQFGTRTRRTYYVNNVYEYHDGNVYLISDGQDASQQGGRSSVQVDGISPSGRDIFFETADQLAPSDVDTQIDIYDARVEGGFPAPSSLLPACSGDACQGQLSSSPTLLSPGSELQAGGNPPLAPPPSATKTKSKPKRCRKGFAKRHGRCVERKTKHAGTSRKGRK